MATTFSEAVASVIRRKMTEKGCSEQSLSELAAIPRVTLRRRLHGSAFNTDELTRIAVILNTTPSMLVVEAESTVAA